MIEISDEEIFDHDINENGVIDPERGFACCDSWNGYSQRIAPVISYKACPVIR